MIIRFVYYIVKPFIIHSSWLHTVTDSTQSAKFRHPYVNGGYQNSFLVCVWCICPYLYAVIYVYLRACWFMSFKMKVRVETNSRRRDDDGNKKYIYWHPIYMCIINTINEFFTLLVSIMDSIENYPFLIFLPHTFNRHFL